MTKTLYSIRAKLIGVFVLIKLIPLILLALFAWWAARELAAEVTVRSSSMADKMLGTIEAVGETVTQDAERALDDRSREAIETVTTDTARTVAAFLYDRDSDILQAARQEPSEAAFRAFLADHRRELFDHGTWSLSADGKRWEPAAEPAPGPAPAAAPQPLADNARDFHVRPPEFLGNREMQPLYVEMTLIGLDGRERVKVQTTSATAPGLADIRDRMQTFARAETYWPDLQKLKPGEIYVSEVIGTYVGSRVIGPYLPKTAEQAGIAYKPEESAYAGTENPVGKRFRGIVRWATPVEREGRRIGYVTLALNHDHLRHFTDRIAPTPQRYAQIADASTGNYAFLWDHKHRAIAHARHYFIVGYNGETGEPETPWLDQATYDAWQASGTSSAAFLKDMPSFQDQSLAKMPALALVRRGTVALDCRYLNFAPQCHGFSQVTANGGSGSFVIFWDGLWKLTTAAAIPYFTGQYGQDQDGFGYVSIGANVDDFHKAATTSRQHIQGQIARERRELQQQRDALIQTIHEQLTETAGRLSVSTALMVGLVVFIAIGMATYLARRITSITDGIRRFEGGDLDFRLKVKSNDEMGALAVSFNKMADSLQHSFGRLTEELDERRRTDELLSIAAIAFEAQEGMVITDPDMVIIQVNNAFCEMTGYAREEIIGQQMSVFKSGRHDAAFYAAMWETIRNTGSWQGEIWDRRKNGEIYPKWLSITAVKRADHSVSHYVGTNTDITSIKAAEDEIRHLAFYDPLTSLPNRRLLIDRLQQALLTAERRGREGALLFIDLDNFKYLNDTLGHHMGDLLLQQVAQRLNGCVRKTDTVARLGGDEFVVMLEGLSAQSAQAAAEAERVGRTILETLNQPYELGGYRHPSTPSIGITLFLGHKSGIEEILKRADLAMYEAKAAGRNTLRFFDQGMQAEVTARALLEADLRTGLHDGQFFLVYQVQVDQAGMPRGAEALLRWRHPQRGVIPPVQFIPLAEETRLIIPLGFWVLETACAQLATWARQPQTALLTLAVNVSAQQFQLSDFVDQVLEIIARTNANPQRLKLELTESMLVSNVERVIDKMLALKKHGVSFSLDDFGTGFSSLAYLKRLPLDQLKIDRSFVQDILSDSNSAVIVNTIIALAHNLNLEVIAEGVETAAQRDHLARQGCVAFQGYLFGQPVPMEMLQLTNNNSLLRQQCNDALSLGQIFDALHQSVVELLQEKQPDLKQIDTL